MFALGLGLIGAPLATLTGQLIGLMPRLVVRVRRARRTSARVCSAPAQRARTSREILRVGVPAVAVRRSQLHRAGHPHRHGGALRRPLPRRLRARHAAGLSALLARIRRRCRGADPGRHGHRRRPPRSGRALRRAVVRCSPPPSSPARRSWSPGGRRSGSASSPPRPTSPPWARPISTASAPSYVFVVASMVVASAFQGLGRADRAADRDGRAGQRSSSPPRSSPTRVLGVGAESIFVIIAAGNVAPVRAARRCSAPRPLYLGTAELLDPSGRTRR